MERRKTVKKASWDVNEVTSQLDKCCYTITGNPDECCENSVGDEGVDPEAQTEDETDASPTQSEFAH